MTTTLSTEYNRNRNWPTQEVVVDLKTENRRQKLRTGKYRYFGYTITKRLHPEGRDYWAIQPRTALGEAAAWTLGLAQIEIVKALPTGAPTEQPFASNRTNDRTHPGH